MSGHNMPSVPHYRHKPYYIHVYISAKNLSPSDLKMAEFGSYFLQRKKMRKALALWFYINHKLNDLQLVYTEM